MEASDGGNPRRTARATIDITIVRNRAPVFAANQVNLPVVQSTASRPAVLDTFVATDADTGVTVRGCLSWYGPNCISI